MKIFQHEVKGLPGVARVTQNIYANEGVGAINFQCSYKIQFFIERKCCHDGIVVIKKYNFISGVGF